MEGERQKEKGVDADGERGTATRYQWWKIWTVHCFYVGCLGWQFWRCRLLLSGVGGATEEREIGEEVVASLVVVEWAEVSSESRIRSPM